MKKSTLFIRLCILVFCIQFTTDTVAQTTISNHNFNANNVDWGIWNDGGDHCKIKSNAPIDGTRAVELKDIDADPTSSHTSMTTGNINLTSYGSATITFDYHSTTFWNGLDFWVQYSSDGGSTWTTVKSYAFGTDFSTNDANHVASVTIGINEYTFTTTSQFRLRSDTTQWTNNRVLYVDNVKIIGHPKVPEIDAKGNNYYIADGDATPRITDNTNYGSANSGITITRDFTIHNTGSLGLNISSIILSNATDFSIVGTPYATPVAVGGYTTFSVRYNALTSGTKNTTVTINNNDSDEATYQFLITAKSEENFYDSDGDGIYDSIDIDDDNDGIKDAVEQAACQNSSIAVTANYKFLNETFGAGNTRTTINTTYDAETTYCYEDGTVGTNTADCPDASKIDLNDGKYTVYHKASNADGINQTPINEVASWSDDYWYTGEDHTPGDTNGRMAMFNASFDPGLFYTASIKGSLPNTPVTYSFWVLNLDTTDAPGIATRLRPNILVEFRDVNNNVLQSITTGDIPPSVNGDPAASWHQFTADLTFPVSEFNVFFINNEVGGTGNDLAIDDITISQTLCDTDGDGVADIFDLDSDNDGIPDVVEAGLGNYSGANATLTNAGTWIDINGNGMHDLIEGNIVLDTDNDGTPNFLDLDSDNDSIFDVDESGAGNTANTTFQNGDGDIDGDGVGDGPDTDDVRPTDLDSDGTLEYYTDGILDIYDYYNGGTFNAAYGNTNQGHGNFYYVLDTDNDGLPDYMDTTSDGTTNDISHTLYSDLDTNNDGIIDDTNDTDHDGIVDLFDTDDTIFGSPRIISRKLLLNFDGRNDYVEDSEFLSGKQNVSIMGWVKIDPSYTGRGMVFGQSNIEIEIQDYFEPRVYARVNGTTIGNNPSTHPIVKNQWFHLAIVFDGTNNSLKLYLNGLEIANSTSAGSVLDTNTYKFTMGRAANFYDTDTYFKGALDEIRVFNKSLSANELQKMVYQEIEDNAGIVRGTEVPKDISDFVTTTNDTPLPWSNLLRYYRLDNFIGDITDDLTTPTIDYGTGAKMYNIKLIEYQSAPMPFLTHQSGDLVTATTIASHGVNGNDAAMYDWSIVKIRHNNVTHNNNHGHSALFIDELDPSNNPITYKVSDDSELNVRWYLKLDGKIDLEGESQLVQGPESELVVSSKGSIERDQQGTQDLYTYNYWSSPVGVSNTSTNNNNYTIPDVLYDGSNPSSPQAINFITNGYDGTSGSPIGIADYWIWKYANLATDYYNWQHVRSTGSMSAGEGFTMKGVNNTGGNVASEQNYVFRGKPNNGDITLTIDDDNDYLVGNPYASAIDADQFINDNTDTNGTIYYWEHFGGGSHYVVQYEGGYATYNLSGAVPAMQHDYTTGGTTSGGTPTKLPGRYIPVAQGFFVKGSSSGTINFNNGQRIFQKEGSSSVFVKQSNPANKSSETTNTDNRLKIRLGFKSVNNTYTRQILVTEDANATPQIDFGYDGESNDEQATDMFWSLNNKKFVIQGTNQIDATTVLPLGIFTNESGINTIKIDALENVPSDLEIYIYDNVTDTYFDIKNNPEFTINLPAGEYLNRFDLRFANENSLSTEDFEAETSLQYYFSNSNETIVISNPEFEIIETVELFNVLGQSIVKYTDIETENTIELKTNNIATGVYIIEIKTDEGKLSKKVLIE